MKKVVIACGGPSSEHEVSLLSCQAIWEAIDKSKYDISIFYISKSFTCTTIEPTEKLSFPTDSETKLVPLIDGIEMFLVGADLVLLAGMHGEFVEDGRFQSLLDYYNVRYSGTKMAASALCMDKYRAAEVVRSIESVIIPKTVLVTDKNRLDVTKFTFPMVIKPNAMGSSVGVSIVSNAEIADQRISKLFRDGVAEIVVQEAVTNMIELSCGCLEDKIGNFTALPPIEIIPQSSAFFDYEAKYTENASLEITPPQHISSELADKISQLTIEIHKLLGCRLYSRSDFLVKGEEIYYLETNTLPGMTKTSLLPQEAKAAGISFTKLLDFMIDNS